MIFVICIREVCVYRIISSCMRIPVLWGNYHTRPCLLFTPNQSLLGIAWKTDNKHRILKAGSM